MLLLLPTAKRAVNTPFSPTTMSYANIGYLGRGYNIFEANPREMTGALDPGYRAPVVACTFNDGRFSGDGRRFVSDHFDVADETAATFTSISTTYSSQSEYLSSLDRSVSFAGSVGAKFTKKISVEARFSASATYQNTVSQMSSSNSVYTQLDGVTSVYRARLRPTFQLDDAFIEAVAALPESDPATHPEANVTYMSFLERYGTHLTTNVVMGGVASVRYTLSQDSFSKFQQELIGGSASASASGRFFSLSASMSVDASSKMQTDARSTLNQMSASMTEWYLGGSPVAGQDMKDGNLDGLKLWSLTVPDAPVPTSIEVADISDLFAREDLFPPEMNSTLRKKGLYFQDTICQASGGSYCTDPLVSAESSDLKFGDYVYLEWFASSRVNTSRYMVMQHQNSLFLDRVPLSWPLPPQDLSRRSSGVIVFQSSVSLSHLRKPSRLRRAKNQVIAYFFGTRVLSCHAEASGECEEASFEHVFDPFFPFLEGFDSIQAPTSSAHGEQVWLFVRDNLTVAAACRAQQLHISCTLPHGSSRFFPMPLETAFPDHAPIFRSIHDQDILRRASLVMTPHLGATIVAGADVFGSASRVQLEDAFPCMARCKSLEGTSGDTFIAAVAPDSLGLVMDSGICIGSSQYSSTCSDVEILRLPTAKGLPRKLRAIDSLLFDTHQSDPPVLTDEARPYVFRLLGPDLIGTRESKPLRNGRNFYLSTLDQPVIYDNNTAHYTDEWPKNHTDPVALRLFHMPSSEEFDYDPNNPYMPSNTTYFILVVNDGAHAGELSFGGPTMPCLGPASVNELVVTGTTPIVDLNVYSQLEDAFCLFKIIRVPPSSVDPIESKYSW